MLTEEEIQKYPEIVEHRTATGDSVFTEEICYPNGLRSPDARSVYRCVKCQKIFDPHDPGIMKSEQ